MKTKIDKNSNSSKAIANQKDKRQSNKNGVSEKDSTIIDNMSNLFNNDFSDINLHTNSNQANNLDALAFTQGNDIHFAPGMYNPDTKSGKELIGHELAHVVQQNNGLVSPSAIKGKFKISENDNLENEADIIGKKAANNEKFNFSSNQNYSSKTNVVQCAKKKGQKRKPQKPKQQQKQQEGKKEWLDRDSFKKDSDSLKKNEKIEQSWLGWAASKIGYGETGGQTEAKTTKDEKTGLSTTGDKLYGELETKLGDEKVVEDLEKAEEDDKKDNAQIFSIKKITINLAEAKGKKEKELGGGVKAEAGGKAGLQASIEGLAGEAEVQVQIGTGGKKLANFSDWAIGNNHLKTGGALEGFLGAKGGGKLKTKLSAKGEKEVSTKLEAFAGAEINASTDILIKAGENELARAHGALGMTVGIGGEISGLIKFDKGTISIGGKAKLSAGLGISMTYKLEFNAIGISATLWNWASSWGSWAISPVWKAMGY